MNAERRSPDGVRSSDDEAAVESIIRQWLSSISSRDLEGVLANHSDDIVMFDVPPPSVGVRGLERYAATWPSFFAWIERGGVFALHALEIEVDRSLALAQALVRCENRDDVSTDHPDFSRLTLGLRKVGEHWLISHEHHSFADRTQT